MKKLLCLLLSAMLLITVADAAAAEKPNTAVDVSRSCTLTLQYAAAGQTVRIYRVADISTDGDYTLCGVFAEYGIHMPAGNAQAEWDVLCDTLTAYITADTITPDSTAITDADGKALFSGLSVGLYLVDEIDMEVGGVTYQYAASLLAVPGEDGNGNWLYDVTAVPKHTEKDSDEDTPVTYTVVKLWAGEKNPSSRPASVEVGLYRDGSFVETKTLSAANNWMYTWTDDTGAAWTAVERDVPDGYTVSVSGERVITIVNSAGRTPGTNDPPRTGDTQATWLYVLLLAASGTGLIVLALLRRRKKDE